MTNAIGLLKWESDTSGFSSAPNFEGFVKEIRKDKLASEDECPWCGGQLNNQHLGHGVGEPPLVTVSKRLNQCIYCGWEAVETFEYSHQIHTFYSYKLEYSVLRNFDVSDEQNVSIKELGTYLKAHYSDIYSISARRFEELIEDVFRNIGFHTRLTKETRDGGADIIILDDGGVKQAIVEVKRYAERRKIGVDIVRKLVGAQIQHEVTKSYIVTTSGFSADAADYAADLGTGRLVIGGQQFVRLDIELWDSLRVLNELGRYNERVVPLNEIKVDTPIYTQIPKQFLLRRKILRRGSHGPVVDLE